MCYTLYYTLYIIQGLFPITIRLRVITTSSWWKCTRPETFPLCRCNVSTNTVIKSHLNIFTSGRQEHLDKDRVNVERHGDPVRQYQGGEDRCKRWIQRSSGGRSKRTLWFISCNNSRLFFGIAFSMTKEAWNCSTTTQRQIVCWSALGRWIFLLCF